MGGRSQLESLAPELLVNILANLPNLASLDNVIRASPAAYRLFDLRSRELFDAVLSSGMTHKYTCALTRIVTVLRCNALPSYAANLDDFQTLVRRETSILSYDDPDNPDDSDGPSEWPFPLTTLPPVTSAVLLRGILATNRKLMRRTVGCLAFYLERFNSLRPMHPVDKDFVFRNKHVGPGRRHVLTWQLEPAETPYATRDIGPPTWVEEQRVLRACWRVQLFHDVEDAVNKSTVTWELDNLGPVDLFKVPSLRGLWNNSDYYEDPWPLPYIWMQGTLFDHELIDTVLYYDKECLGSTLNEPNWPMLKPTGQCDYDNLDFHSSETYAFFFQVGGQERIHTGRSPIQHVKFEPYRRFGFAIWSLKRMEAYGFVSTDDTQYNINSAFLAWKSVLTKDEVEEVLAVNRSWDGDLM